MKKLLRWLFNLFKKKIFKRKQVESLENIEPVIKEKTQPFKGYYRPKKFKKPLPKKRFRNIFIKHW